MPHALRALDSALAIAIRRREPEAVATLLRTALRPTASLVPRPWGGAAIAAHKQLDVDHDETIGESFELAAAPSDGEAAAFGSFVELADGGIMPLSTVLHACPEILGAAHIEAFGHELPLLPKLLDVHALLSLQAHPAGRPELYMVIDAEPGATIQLGLARPLDADMLARRVAEGTALQERLAAGCADDAARARRWSQWLLSDGGAPLPDATPEQAQALRALAAINAELRGCMHAIPVAPGTVIHNAVPHPDDGLASSTLHALGNPAGRRVLALELRLAGETLRVWDHGRLPARALALREAMANLPTGVDDPAHFMVAEADGPLALDNGVFTAERVPLTSNPVVRSGTGLAVFVHALHGRITLRGPADVATVIEPGHSALVPAAWAQWSAHASEHAAVMMLASACIRPTRLARRSRALAQLRHVVADDHGPREVLLVANGGDGPLVAARTAARTQLLFRADGRTRITAHEERTRRGQLLGLLDAVAHLRAQVPAPDPGGVALGIMLPGQGTRLSPLTQRLHGIKPFARMPIRSHAGAPWLDAGAASLWSWGLVTRALERAGFAGVAWKWGDEPQLPSEPLEQLALELRSVDAVRFGMRVQLDEDLARNKEWLLRDGDGRLAAQVRRRPLAALRERLAQAPVGTRALVNMGSPALSHAFIDALAAAFGDRDGWLDVDGYLFEALTHDEAAWAAEIARDPGLRALLEQCPDFYARVARVRAQLEQHRGAPLAIAVIDFGADTYWGDMGQLSRARDAHAVLARADDDGEFARRLACIDDVVPDRFGNRVVGDSWIPGDGSLRDSVIIDSWIARPRSTTRRAVVIDSELGETQLGDGAVVLDSSVWALDADADAFVFAALAPALQVAAHHVHTTMPVDPRDASALTLEQWCFDMREDPGSPEHYRSRVPPNPASFAEKFAQMRQRERDPEAIERALLGARRPWLQRIAAAIGLDPAQVDARQERRSAGS